MTKRFGHALSVEELEAVRVRVLGRKGLQASIAAEIKELPPAERPQAGKIFNDLKKGFETLFATKAARGLF